MFNPDDRSTINAMIKYRHDQILENVSSAKLDVEREMIVMPSSRRVRPVRRSIGLSLMRFGARLAGVGFHTRMSY